MTNRGESKRGKRFPPRPTITNFPHFLWQQLTVFRTILTQPCSSQTKVNKRGFRLLCISLPSVLALELKPNITNYNSRSFQIVDEVYINANFNFFIFKGFKIPLFEHQWNSEASTYVCLPLEPPWLKIKINTVYL